MGDADDKAALGSGAEAYLAEDNHMPNGLFRLPIKSHCGCRNEI